MNTALRANSTLAAKALRELAKHDKRAADRLIREASEHCEKMKGNPHARR